MSVQNLDQKCKIRVQILAALARRYACCVAATPKQSTFRLTEDNDTIPKLPLFNLPDKGR
jgi:hypothetical protein